MINAGVSPARWAVVGLFSAFLSAGCAARTVVASCPGQEMTLPEGGVEQEPRYSWVPDLLYGIIDSPNPAALDDLYDAAFAAGPAIVPELVRALPDDRTAEFAAQSLAFIGGSQAISALEQLVCDPRDLDLRQFYYGALGGLDDPQSNSTLLRVIRNANNEPDRSVTEAAIIALTVRSDPSLIPPLNQAEAKLTDPVIQDDLSNAISIIQARARYLASERSQHAARSIDEAVRIYFLPAIQMAALAKTGSRRARPATHSRRLGFPAGSSFHIEHVEYGPNKSRALARVIFEDPAVAADYRIVLQKKGSAWTVATAWLGAEQEKGAT